MLVSGPVEVAEAVGAEEVTESRGTAVDAAGGGVSVVPWGSGSLSAEAGSAAKSNSERRWLRDAVTRAVYDGG